MERTTKVILVSVPSVKGHSRWEWRAVECRTNQAGHLNERGVRTLWRSHPCYRPHARYRDNRETVGEAAENTARAVAREHLASVLDLPVEQVVGA